MLSLTDWPSSWAIPKSHSSVPVTALHPHTSFKTHPQDPELPPVGLLSSNFTLPPMVARMALDHTWSPHFLTWRGPGVTLFPGTTQTLSSVKTASHTLQQCFMSTYYVLALLRAQQ